MDLVNIDYFLDRIDRFPWDIMDLTLPKYGPPHSYICSAVAPYLDPYKQMFYLARPNLNELTRFAKEDQGLTSLIIEHCEKGLRKRMDVDRIVLEFLSNFDPFRNDFSKRINMLYRSGRIKIPKESLWQHK